MNSAELIQAGGKTLCSENHNLLISIWKYEEFLQEWKGSFGVLSF
jgi:hypothetical protein